MPYIENSLAYIVNTSLEGSKFSDDWKMARVTSIFGEGEKSDKSNYRPISVLPVICRLFEKLVFNQLYQYHDHNGLLSPNQSAFRRLHSTVTSLIRNADDWYTGLDSFQMLGMLVVDLKRPLVLLIIVFSVIRLGCMGFNRVNSPVSNATSLTEHNTLVYVAMTLIWGNLKLVFHKGYTLDLSYF